MDGDEVPVLGCTVVVSDGVTLTLLPGTVKGGGYAFSLGDGGTLNVAGSAASPVTITSYRGRLGGWRHQW